MSSLDFDQPVIVKDTDRTCASGTAGWHRRVVGKSYEDDDLQRSVLAYAVAMDENGEKVWMVDTEDLEADGT